MLALPKRHIAIIFARVGSRCISDAPLLAPEDSQNAIKRVAYTICP